MAIELDGLTLKELRDLQTQVGKAIATFEDRKKKEALADLEERAKTMGFTLAELTGAQAARKKSVPTAKYANPEDRSQTWSGRGRKPRWFDAALKSGRPLDDLSV